MYSFHHFEFINTRFDFYRPLFWETKQDVAIIIPKKFTFFINVVKSVFNALWLERASIKISPGNITCCEPLWALIMKLYMHYLCTFRSGHCWCVHSVTSPNHPLGILALRGQCWDGLKNYRFLGGNMWCRDKKHVAVQYGLVWALSRDALHISLCIFCRKRHFQTDRSVTLWCLSFNQCVYRTSIMSDFSCTVD